MQEQSSSGAFLKRYRLAAGLSQEALAARAGLSARTISDLERGIHGTPIIVAVPELSLKHLAVGSPYVERIVPLIPG